MYCHTHTAEELILYASCSQSKYVTGFTCTGCITSNKKDRVHVVSGVGAKLCCLCEHYLVLL